MYFYIYNTQSIVRLTYNKLIYSKYVYKENENGIESDKKIVLPYQFFEIYIYTYIIIYVYKIGSFLVLFLLV